MHAKALVITVVLLAGCTGAIGDAGDAEERAGGAGESPTTAAFGPAPGGVRRLTLAQYQNSVRDLLGEAVTMPSDIPAVDSGPYGFATINAATVEIAGLAVEKFDAAARALARGVISDTTARAKLLGCSPDDACVEAFVRRFGRRAFRRPLTTEELASYRALVAAVAADHGDVWIGIEHAIAAMLQAPSFLYLQEVGEGAGVRRLDGYEMAARLSFFLWNSTPDDALLDAAERGELATPEGVRRAARRLLESPRARAAVVAFFGEQLKIDGLEQVSKSPTLFPTWSPNLARSMRTEVERVVEAIVFDRKADFRTLLDTRDTFIDGNLASLYGLPRPAGSAFEPVKLPEGSPRAGLLGFAGIMAASARETETSPTRRGLFIRQRLLCLDLPPPPDALADLIAEEQVKAASGEHRTMRERLERQRTDSACSHCHALMDPPGLALEHFDGIGAYRESDRGLPIDASGDLDGRAFVGAVGLSGALRDDPRFSSCLTRQVYRFASGHVEGPGETGTLASLSTSFAASGYRFDELLVEIAGSDGFRFAADPR